MKIRRIATYAVEIPIRRELIITSSLGQHSVSRSLLVALETEDRIIGIGEATVTPQWSGETIWGAQAIVEECLAPIVQGRSVTDIAGVLEAMDQAVAHNSFAKAAIETALWDAWGKTVRKPVYELFGGAVRDLALPIRFSLAAATPTQTADHARQRVQWGHRTIKVKVGLDPRADVERVRAVRDAIGYDVALTVDANGGWSVEDAVWALKQMRDLDLLLAEQPVRREDLDGMAEVRRRVDLPIMADESVFTLWDARRALAKEACDVISVYPGKNGGLLVSYQITELAAEYDVPCAVGSNLELDPGTAAMCHLSVAAPNVAAERLHGDILGPLYQEQSIVTNPLRLENGYIHCPTGPGFGLELNRDTVRRLSI